MTLEQLLNKLIQKGWKPFKVPCKYFEKCNGLEGIPFYHFISNNVLFPGGTRKYSRPSLRQIVSKESGLWQFCVENKLVNKYADLGPDEEEAYIGKWKSGLDAIDINGDYIRLDDDYDEYHQDTDDKYWLIESALKDELELERFLLDNIKL